MIYRIEAGNSEGISLIDIEAKNEDHAIELFRSRIDEYLFDFDECSNFAILDKETGYMIPFDIDRDLCNFGQAKSLVKIIYKHMPFLKIEEYPEPQSFTREALRK